MYIRKALPREASEEVTICMSIICISIAHVIDVPMVFKRYPCVFVNQSRDGILLMHGGVLGSLGTPSQLRPSPRSTLTSSSNIPYYFRRDHSSLHLDLHLCSFLKYNKIEIPKSAGSRGSEAPPWASPVPCTRTRRSAALNVTFRL